MKRVVAVRNKQLTLKMWAQGYFDRLARRAMRQGPTITFGMLRDGREFYDISEIAALIATVQSAAFYEREMLLAKSFSSPDAIREFAIAASRPGGMVLEFGVASGGTLSLFASHAGDRALVGFDTFEGLPEDWRTGRGRGAYACEAPNIPASARIIKGLFSDTLPSFAQNLDKPISLIHIDCDLYSSTKCVFDNLADHILPGCVILFDEFLNYPGWRKHEYKAFREFVGDRKLDFEYVAFVPAGHQVCVVIK